MSIGTAKQEALEALSILDTAERGGDVWRNCYQIVAQLTDDQAKMKHAVWFQESIEKCLTLLPLPKTHRWVLSTKPYGAQIWRDGSECLADEIAVVSLQNAMLKAWWSIQPERETA